MTEKPKVKIRKRDAKSYSIDTGCGKLDTTFYLGTDKTPTNCKSNFGKSGGCGHSQVEAISRLIKLLLKHGSPLTEIHKQLIGIQCGNATPDGVLSCADAIGKEVGVLMDDLNLTLDESLSKNK